MHVAAKMQQYTTPVRYREQRDLDVGEIELLAAIVFFVAESGLDVVDGLVLTILGQLSVTQISFQGIGPPFGVLSPWTTILICKVDLSVKFPTIHKPWLDTNL